MRNRRILVLLLAASMFLVAALASSAQAVSNYSGRGGSDQTVGAQSIDGRAIWSDPLPPPDFEIGFFLDIDIDAPEPMHLPGIGAKEEFSYDDPQVLIRGFTKTWTRASYYIRLVWNSPDGQSIRYMPQLFIPHPHAVVAMWDYWEWTAWWQYLFTKDMEPGAWSVDVYFRWGNQPEEMEQLIATESFTLNGIRPSSVQESTVKADAWTSPVPSIVTLCRGIDLDAMEFDMMPPVGRIYYGDIISGTQDVWAYVRFINDFANDRILDESFHVVFDFRYEDPNVKFDFVHMDPYIFDVPHARTSFKTWEYWDRYYVTAIDFNPAELGMCAGTWYIDIYAYPHSGDISMKVSIGTIAFVVEGGVPEPPNPNVSEDAVSVTVTPNPFADEARFEASVPGIFVDTLEVSVYDMTGHLVFVGSGINVVKWDGRDLNGMWLSNGAYIYIAVAGVGDTEKTAHGIVCIKQ